MSLEGRKIEEQDTVAGSRPDDSDLATGNDRKKSVTCPFTIQLGL